MDKIDWLLLKTLYSDKSMAKAAEKLFISQPAVSYRMTRMEQEFDQVLFLRSNKGISLTSAGIRLYTFANLMLQYEEDISSYVRQEGEELSGLVTIGVTTTFLNIFLVPQIRQFCDKYPKIRIGLTVEPSLNLRNMMANNRLMMAVIRGPHEWNGPAVELFEEPLEIISSEPITEEMLHTRPFISNCMRSPLTLQIEQWLSDNFDGGLPPAAQVEVYGDSRNLVNLVKVGFGWAIISNLRIDPRDGLYHQPIFRKDGSNYLYKTHLVYSEECRLFDTYMTYIDHLKAYFGEGRGRLNR